jgi:hypothetical protein
MLNNNSYIRESFLRNKIRNLLLEAVIDDLISKSKRDEDEWKQLEDSFINAGIQKNSSTIGNYLKWVFRYVSENSDEPLEDIVGLILDFDELKNKPSKWKIRNDQGEFEKLSPDIFSFDRNNLAITIETVKQGDLDYLEKKASTGIEPIAKIDKWEIYFPTNIPESVEIANRGGIISWCTGRTSNNLFYAYALNNTFLFYILESGNPTNKYCIGVQSGRIVPGDRHGGVTVDMDNNGFEDGYQTKIFGNIIKHLIHKKLLEVNSKFGQVHPAREIPLKAMGNLKTWKQMVGPWSKDNRKDFLEYWFNERVFKSGYMSKDVYKHIVENCDYYSICDKVVILLLKIAKFSVFSENKQFNNEFTNALNNLKSWENFIIKFNNIEKLVIIQYCFFTIANSFNLKNNVEREIIMQNILFKNPKLNFPNLNIDGNSETNCRPSELIYNDALHHYCNLIHKHNSKLNKAVDAINSLQKWEQVIMPFNKLARFILLTDERFGFEKYLKNNTNLIKDSKDVLRHILNNPGEYANTKPNVFFLENKLTSIFIDIYLPNKISKFGNIAEISILQDYKLWKDKIIDSKIPDPVIVEIFKDCFIEANIDFVLEYDKRVIKELKDIVTRIHNNTDGVDHNRNYKTYFIRYLIILNNGLDMNLWQKFTESFNEQILIETLFSKHRQEHNLNGTGLIKKEIYNYVLDNIENIYNIDVNDPHRAYTNQEMNDIVDLEYNLRHLSLNLNDEPFTDDASEIKEKIYNLMKKIDETGAFG